MANVLVTPQVAYLTFDALVYITLPNHVVSLTFWTFFFKFCPSWKSRLPSFVAIWCHDCKERRRKIKKHCFRMCVPKLSFSS